MIVSIMLFKLALLLGLTLFVYYLIDYIRSNRAIEKSFAKLYSNTEEKYSKRKDEKERFYLEEGNKSKESFFYGFDLLIERSGLRKKYSFLTTEIYIGLTVVLSVIGYILGSIFGGMILGAIVITFIVVISYGVLYIKAGTTYEKIDEETIPFINLLENYAGSDSDIVNIMGHVYPYLNDPLKSYIESFYIEATASGDYQKTFMNLENKIESVRLKSIIRNIEICSRHEANYEVIIKDERRSLRNYSKAKEKRKQIIRKGRNDIISCLAMGGILIMMISSFAPTLFGNLINTTVGNMILLYCIIVLGMCAYNFIAFDKGEKV